jgi:Flp pilus assembly CpaE family ATPase
MDPNHITILLIEDTPAYAELVQRWVSGSDHAAAFSLSWTDTLVAGLHRLARGGVNVILLDLNLPDSDGMETFVKAKAHANGIPIILLSAADSESLALQMIQEGAADYLVKSTCNGSALIRALRYAVVRHRMHASEIAAGHMAQRRIIGVIGAKGGVGATTVACHLASELRLQTGQNVLLADLDVNAGLVSLAFGLDCRYSLLDVIDNIPHLDRTCWERLVTRAAGEFDILPSPGLLGAGELSADSIRQILTLVLPYYDWIILDLGRLNSMIMRLRDRLSEILIVTGSGIASLYETKRMTDALTRAGTEVERLRLVVNEIAPEGTLTGKELKQMFGIPVYARLRGDGQELDSAWLQRRLPAQNNALRRQIRLLARRVAGLPMKRAGWNLARLLPFRDRDGASMGSGRPAQ